MRVNLNQGSEDWLLWREAGVGGSDVAAIMGVSPWTTAYQLWEYKTGRVPRPDLSKNWGVIRGTRLEPLARELYEKATGLIVPDGCYIDDERPWMKASLDGITMDETLVAEFKAPGEEAHRMAMGGEIPWHYELQCRWYMKITGATHCDYASLYFFEGVPDLAIVRIERDEDIEAEFIGMCQQFMLHIKNDNPPPLEERDSIDVSDDTDWEAMELRLSALRKVRQEVDEEEAELVAAMKKRADDEKQSVRGRSFTVTRFWKSGNMDTTKWLEDTGQTIPEEYRRPGSYQIQVRERKNK